MARTDLSYSKPTAAPRRGTVQPAELGCEPCPHCGLFVPVGYQFAHDCAGGGWDGMQERALRRLRELEDK